LRSCARVAVVRNSAPPSLAFCSDFARRTPQIHADRTLARSVREGYAEGRLALTGTSSLALTARARSPAARERSPQVSEE